jgi:hypothetical protein
LSFGSLFSPGELRLRLSLASPSSCPIRPPRRAARLHAPDQAQFVRVLYVLACQRPVLMKNDAGAHLLVRILPPGARRAHDLPA